MIGIDTNVLVRYLAQDDPAQSVKATQLFERVLTEDKPGFVSVVALVETVWVLERAYGLTVHEIAAAIEQMLQADTLSIQNEQEVFSALIAYKQGQSSFSDALIGTIGEWAGCTSTVTFDKKATRLKTFRLL